MTNEKQTKPRISEDSIYDPFLCQECAPFGYCWKKYLSKIDIQDEKIEDTREFNKKTQLQIGYEKSSSSIIGD